MKLILQAIKALFRKIETNVSALETNVSALETNVSALETNVSTYTISTMIGSSGTTFASNVYENIAAAISKRRDVIIWDAGMHRVFRMVSWDSGVCRFVATTYNTDEGAINYYIFDVDFVNNTNAITHKSVGVS